VGIAGALHLSYLDHRDHLNAAQLRACGIRRLEVEHRPHPAFDGTMILLNAIV
jgi:hypothetical protein